jgi:hypothetical protein
MTSNEEREREMDCWRVRKINESMAAMYDQQSRNE